MKKKRDPLPDLLKGLAVLLMILVHIAHLFGNPVFQLSFAGRLVLFLGGFPAAPVFMMIMGWFAFASASLRKDIIRGIGLLGLGLLLNIVLNTALLVKIVMGLSDVDPIACILGADILFLAGLSLIMAGVLKKLTKGRWWILVVAATGVAFVAPYLNSSIPTHGIWKYIKPLLADKAAWWSYFPVFPWLAYVLTGMAAAGIRAQSGAIWASLGSIPVKAACGLVFLAGLPFGWETSTRLPEYYQHSLWFYLWAVSACSTWIFIWQFISYKIPEIHILGWAGRYVTRIYVIQWVIIGNAATWLYQSQSGRAVAFWFAAVTALSIALAHLSLKAGMMARNTTGRTAGKQV